MKIYTKTGDKGTTSLFSGERVAKNSFRIELYGTIDEMMSAIVIALEFAPPEKISIDLNNILAKSYRLCSDFSTIIDSKNNDKVKRITDDDVLELETMIDNYFKELPELKSFIKPGGSKCAGFINQARTICRRAERIATNLSSSEQVNESAMRFINRLSDYLFAVMRYTNFLNNSKENTFSI
jgi:cob(I)alamin adenosyltransferase